MLRFVLWVAPSRWRSERETGEGVREAEKVEVSKRVREAESTAT